MLFRPETSNYVEHYQIRFFMVRELKGIVREHGAV